MSINNVEIQDSNGNVYYPHTDSSVVKFGNSDVGTALSEKANDTDSARTTTSKTVTGAINELNSNKINKTSIVNNLTATVAGSVLDATQGKVISDLITGCMKNGYGVDYGNNIFGNDLNTWNISGVYQCNSSTTNVPSGTDGWGTLANLITYNSSISGSTGVQFFYAWNYAQIYIRYKRGTTFSTWKSLL
ncbi:pyocin knob domain-containing protein [Clostridium sp. BL-8]|uniref:pyocin knob domain-containing protein n=1 Tax=Clostridium sp. BL-8 TaxID=349938 RepID=UPI00098C3F65|nr:pyocin knob domain-containing protein [Clostridium sp. BL-8]OOM80950.1 hypothetical protein CLOBL_05490 [Clostridium sp. BL-8]